MVLTASYICHISVGRQLCRLKPGVLDSGTAQPHLNVLSHAGLCLDANLWLASEMSAFFLSAITTNYVSK